MMADDLLTDITRAVDLLKGYFVFEGEGGKEFVIATEEDFRNRKLAKHKETQLSLSDSRFKKENAHSMDVEEEEKRDEDIERGGSIIGEEGESIDDFLERINREIAIYRQQQEEAEKVVEDSGLIEEKGGLGEEENVAKEKIKFEPLKGDLSPDLQ